MASVLVAAFSMFPEAKDAPSTLAMPASRNALAASSRATSPLPEAPQVIAERSRAWAEEEAEEDR